MIEGIWDFGRRFFKQVQNDRTAALPNRSGGIARTFFWYVGDKKGVIYEGSFLKGC